MLLFRYGFSILLFVTSCAAARAQEFPTNEDIDLMLTQADRAVQQYKPLIEQQEQLLGKKAQEAAAKDREVVRALEKAIKLFDRSRKVLIVRSDSVSLSGSMTQTGTHCYVPAEQPTRR